MSYISINIWYQIKILTSIDTTTYTINLSSTDTNFYLYYNKLFLTLFPDNCGQRILYRIHVTIETPFAS